MSVLKMSIMYVDFDCVSLGFATDFEEDITCVMCFVNETKFCKHAS